MTFKKTKDKMFTTFHKFVIVMTHCHIQFYYSLFTHAMGFMNDIPQHGTCVQITDSHTL